MTIENVLRDDIGTDQGCIVFFFVKSTSIGPISDQICLQNCEKILKAKFTNSDDDLWSLGKVTRRFAPKTFRP